MVASPHPGELSSCPSASLGARWGLAAPTRAQGATAPRGSGEKAPRSRLRLVSQGRGDLSRPLETHCWPRTKRGRATCLASLLSFRRPVPCLPVAREAFSGLGEEGPAVVPSGPCVTNKRQAGEKGWGSNVRPGGRLSVTSARSEAVPGSGRCCRSVCPFLDLHFLRPHLEPREGGRASVTRHAPLPTDWQRAEHSLVVRPRFQTLLPGCGALGSRSLLFCERGAQPCVRKAGGEASVPGRVTLRIRQRERLRDSVAVPHRPPQRHHYP